MPKHAKPQPNVPAIHAAALERFGRPALGAVYDDRDGVVEVFADTWHGRPAARYAVERDGSVALSG